MPSTFLCRPASIDVRLPKIVSSVKCFTTIHPLTPNVAHVLISSNWSMMLEVRARSLPWAESSQARRFSLIEDHDHRLCQFDDERDQCRFFYTYHTENDQLVLRVQKTKSKPSSSLDAWQRALFPRRLPTYFIRSFNNIDHRLEYLSIRPVLPDGLAYARYVARSTRVRQIRTRTRKGQMGNRQWSSFRPVFS